MEQWLQVGIYPASSQDLDLSTVILKCSTQNPTIRELRNTGFLESVRDREG
jgi:hypothetical protein